MSFRVNYFFLQKRIPEILEYYKQGVIAGINKLTLA